MGLYWYLPCSVLVSGLVLAGSLIPRLLHYPLNVFSLMIHYLLFFLYVIKFVYTQITPCASSLKSIQQCSPRKRLAKVSEQSAEQFSNCITFNCECPEHEGDAVLPLAAAEPLILPIETRWWEGILQFRRGQHASWDAVCRPCLQGSWALSLTHSTPFIQSHLFLTSDVICLVLWFHPFSGNSSPSLLIIMHW